MFGVGAAPLGELRRMVDPPVDTTGQRVHIVHGEQRFVQQRELPAALSDDEAITGTRPAAMPSMTLTDSRSAIDGCTSRSPERSNAGMSAFRWNPIEAGRDNSRPAIRCNLFLSGPVPAITNSMSCA